MGSTRGAALNPRLYYLGAAIFILLTLAIRYQKDRADFVSDNWVKTEGVITDSKLIEDTGGPRSYSAFGIRLWYNYETPDGIYSGGPVEADRNTLHTRKSAEKALRGRFAPGQPIEVYFDPRDTSASALGSSHAPSRLWQIFLLFIAAAFIYQARGR